MLVVSFKKQLKYISRFLHHKLKDDIKRQTIRIIIWLHKVLSRANKSGLVLYTSIRMIIGSKRGTIFKYQSKVAMTNSLSGNITISKSCNQLPSVCHEQKSGKTWRAPFQWASWSIYIFNILDVVSCNFQVTSKKH